MGNPHWSWGIRLVFICIVLVTMKRKCMGGGNLTTASCYEQERQALLEFKHSVTDYNGMLSTWGVGDDCCRWERVGCDNVTGRVVSLHLRPSAKQHYYNIDADNYLSDEYYGTQVQSLKL
ncbi:hypothetical protein QVD17_32230 [Tagetes erecta]|uniref:Leucine-rich repeat-containing N-terminal plant-type domain-containing protein n=1 Tax=Tagetes erecta TaxID=13708 RepID=A0AAD8K4V6_TARER|nr:hypothetical protein QVD17_32230 [Tagetes erecta]